MPSIDITYSGLMRTAVRNGSERLHLPPGATLGDLLEEVVHRHGAATRDFLFDDACGLLPHANVLVNGSGVRDMAACVGPEDATVRILVMSPMMVGG